MSIEAMKQALEALEKHYPYEDESGIIKLSLGWYMNGIQYLRQAIAEAEGISLMPIRHPVGPKWDGDINPDSLEEIEIDLPKREWVGLTDEEINDVLPGHRVIDALDIYYRIEAKLKEKNCG